MSIDFKTTGADDGFNHSEAIQPYDNGESADQTVLRRPPENLRVRTEELRQKVNQLEMVMQSDRGLCLVGDSSVQLTWDKNAGKITSVYGDFYLVPMISMANGADNGVAISTKYFYSQGGNTFQVVANPALHAYLGSNDLYFKIFKNGRDLVTPVVTVEGADGGGTYPQDGPILIAVEIDKDGTHTLQNVVDAINAAALPYLDTTNTIVLSGGANAVTEISERRFYTDAGGQGGVDIEAHKISASDLAAFSYTHPMNDGDTLVINYANAVDRLSNEAGSSMSGMFEIITGPLTRRLTFNPATYTDVVLTGPGTIVGLGSASDGTLVSYDNTNHVWIVKADAASDNFPVGDTIHLVAPDVGQGTIVTSTTADSRNIAEGHVIPLFKRFGDMLHCINGRAFQHGIEDYLILTTNTKLTNDLSLFGFPYGDYMIGSDDKTTGIFTLGAGTVNSQLRTIAKLGDTGPTKGDTIVGALVKTATSGSVSWTLPTGSVSSQTQEIVTSLVKTVAAPATGASHIGAIAKTGAGGATWSLTGGSVDAQLTKILDDLTENTAPPTGDVRIGASAKTAALGWSLTKGTVGSQVQEVLTNLAATVGTSGDARVGGDVKTVSPLTCAAGSLNTQLKGLITDTAAHINATLYKHKLRDVEPTSRPFVIVDTAGNGDYATLEAAVTALAATGGLILAMGTSSHEHISTVVSRPITIIGHKYTCQNGVGVAALTITEPPTAPITFMGIRFLAVDDPPLLYDEEVPAVGGKLIFDSCIFDMNSIGGALTTISGRLPRAFTNCTFLGSGYAEMGTAILQSGFSGNTSLEMYNCYASGFGAVIATAHNTTYDIAFSIENNNFVNCGWTAGVPMVLISGGTTTSKVSGYIAANVVSYTGSPPTQNSALFFECGSGSVITVEGNKILRGCMDISGSAGAHMITVVANSKCTVTNNYVHCGMAGGINSGGTICGNYIDLPLGISDTECHAIAVPKDTQSLVERNSISVYSISEIIRLGEPLHNAYDTVCTNNTIIISDACTYGILAYIPEHVIIANNVIRATTSDLEEGIYVHKDVNTTEGHAFSVIGNVIEGVDTGIFIQGYGVMGVHKPFSCFSVSNNIIRTNAGAITGIRLVECTNGTVTGNTIYGNVSGGTGVLMDSTSTNIGYSANSIFECATPQDISSDTVGVGGTPARDITINWYTA